MGSKPVYKPRSCGRSKKGRGKRRKPHRKVSARAVRARKNRAIAAGGAGGLVTCDPARSDVTPGRNDPCPCSSGLKYKRCCLG